MNKLLLGILAILLLTVTGEVGYFWGRNSSQLPVSNSAHINDAQPTNTANAQSSCSAPSPNHAINDETWERFRQYDKRALYTATATNTFRGRIAEVEFQNGLKLQIDGVNDAFLFSAQNLVNLRVTQIVSGKEEQFSVKSLKAGDQVLMEVTIDLTKDPDVNFLSGKITKLK